MSNDVPSPPDVQQLSKLGKAIQVARQNHSLTQQELCHLTSLSYSTLAKIERGAIKAPSVFTVHSIAEALGTSLDDLLGSVSTPKGSVPKAQKHTSKSGISFIYFDINGCLVRFFHGAFTHIAQDTGVSSERIETAFWHLNDAACRGDLSMSEFNKQFAKHIGVDAINWTDYYLDSLEPVIEMNELLKWAANNYQVGLLSNIMPGHINAMMQKGLIPKVAYDVIIDSSELKSIKPELKIYEIAQTKASVPPAEILFVDDSRTNLMAAERQEWKVLWFDDAHPQESVNKIRSSLEF